MPIAQRTDIALVIWRYLWHKTAMPIWLERFALAVLATSFGGIIILNVMKLTPTQRITLGIAIVAISLFVADLLYNKQKSTPAIPMSQRGAIVIDGIAFIRPADAPKPDVPLVADRMFYIDVTFLSKGAISADEMAITAFISIAPKDSERGEQERLWEKVRKQSDQSSYGENSLFPGKDAIISIPYPLQGSQNPSVSRDDIEQIQTDDKKILLAGIVKYRDEYGPLETQFCQSYSGKSWRLWGDCWGHNQITAVTKVNN